MKITKKMKKLKNKSEYLNVSKKVIFSGAAGEKPIFFIDILKKICYTFNGLKNVEVKFMIRKKKKFIVAILGAIFFGGVNNADTTNKIKSTNVVNVTRKPPSPLKIFGIMAGSFVGLSALISAATLVGLKISDEKFKNSDAGKRSEEFKKECEKIDKDNEISEKEMVKQRLWKKHYVDNL